MAFINCDKSSGGSGASPSNDTIVTTHILIKVGDQSFRVGLYNNATNQSLIAQLPLTVELEDYGGLEKIFYPPEKLSKAGAPEGATPKTGDMMYYAPWGDVAIFYKGFRYADGLIPMGQVEDVAGLVDALKSGGPTATIELE